MGNKGFERAIWAAHPPLFSSYYERDFPFVHLPRTDIIVFEFVLFNNY